MWLRKFKLGFILCMASQLQFGFHYLCGSHFLDGIHYCLGFASLLWGTYLKWLRKIILVFISHVASQCNYGFHNYCGFTHYLYVFSDENPLYFYRGDFHFGSVSHLTFVVWYFLEDIVRWLDIVFICMSEFCECVWFV